MSFEILTLNNIAAAGLDRLPRERYDIISEMRLPDAILVRSADMHELALPASLKAVGRAGVGVNNIPVDALSKRGVPVFNAPGANANAVKELVLAGLLLAARQVCVAWDFVRGLEGDDETLDRIVEKEKKRFVGFELPGKCLGVVGLGAVGVEVANAALALGMKVLGYDPQLTVQRAWQLSANVEQAMSLDHLFARADAITLHTPLTPQTRGLVNAQRLALMKPGAYLINSARGDVIDQVALVQALKNGVIAGAALDVFEGEPAVPEDLKRMENVVLLPHLGSASMETRVAMGMRVFDNLKAFFAGKEPHDRVV
jgi:D-3-phosphoglycerate dehydrogenase / 2-oxoglutarate reductase